ncbi:MAG TPA: hypothetical protein P5032_13335 [Candidatus Competibacter sp.]|nr:hypothetical protein [Candidatus Competibacteraceae bacterium]HRW66698.1 hypothetical protein [Candidatus Competibacter sp.]
MAQTIRSQRMLGTLPNNNQGQIPGQLRFDISLGDVIDALRWTNPVTFSGKLLQTTVGVEPNLFFVAEQIIRASATRITIPIGHILTLKRYANANPGDGKILNNALAQEPSYYRDGWLLSVNGTADAMTFGNSIFFRQAVPSVDTYIHEMVHIDQYDRAGRTAFLTSYFGLSLATIIWRVIRGHAINAMSSSPHEKAAYGLERRFSTWITKNP